MTAQRVNWRVLWLSGSAPSGRASHHEFADKPAAERFLRLIKRVIPPEDLAVALVEPWTDFSPL